MEAVRLCGNRCGWPVRDVPDFCVSPVNLTAAIDRISELWNPQLRAEGSYSDRSDDRTRLLSYLSENPRELLIGIGPGNFHWYQARGITWNFFGHNSYLHWTGELGIGGLFLLLAWCLSVCVYTSRRRGDHNPLGGLAARTCLAVVIGRMVAAWGAESLFGTEGMGYYSLFFVGIVYLLVWIGSKEGTTVFRLQHQFSNKRGRDGMKGGMNVCVPIHQLNQASDIDRCLSSAAKPTYRPLVNV